MKKKILFVVASIIIVVMTYVCYDEPNKIQYLPTGSTSGGSIYNDDFIKNPTPSRQINGLIRKDDNYFFEIERLSQFITLYNLRVTEIGSGYGTIAKEFIRRYPTTIYTCIDKYYKMLQHAKRVTRNECNYICGDINDIDTWDSFPESDLTIIYDSHMYIKDIREFHEILSLKSKFVFIKCMCIDSELVNQIQYTEEGDIAEENTRKILKLWDVEVPRSLELQKVFNKNYNTMLFEKVDIKDYKQDLHIYRSLSLLTSEMDFYPNYLMCYRAILKSNF